MLRMRLNTPCEHVLWNVLPAVRKELAILLVKKHSLSQREAAKHLGVTEAAVSQYLKSKRGSNIMLNQKAKKRIGKLAQEMIDSKKKFPKNNKNMCSLCKFVRENKIIKVCE